MELITFIQKLSQLINIMLLEDGLKQILVRFYICLNVDIKNDNQQVILKWKRKQRRQNFISKIQYQFKYLEFKFYSNLDYHYQYPQKFEYDGSFLNSYKFLQLNSERTQTTLWFDLQSEPTTHNYKFDSDRNQFSNTLNYMYIGGDKFTLSPYFEGSLAYLEFLTGFDQDFNIQDYQQCHNSCKSCDGPESKECTCCSAFSF
ncbi:unnamed protein product (macronuclear) [Paramecium tetraurelia]|uniref:Uncharacterized protein n=1 Tax=Paramecium tetraurelia TaxID=5888 RepID=A0CGG3_PARTE|nr:uncharacterized protein GSPATT00007320001 [Paramecium tetraurelia]CAK69880.1 unnamed protein product [Paramecium tetraurelia]|eukprot:XP_001437277.1 hypothetical protein (macronuclear) [Paramecium tetraurelia strain d4-2]